MNTPQSIRRGFTLIELLVVISVIALLISILLPALAEARRSAQATQCAANIRSIGQLQAIYVDSYRDYFSHVSNPAYVNYQKWTTWGTWYANMGQLMSVQRLTANGGLSQLDFKKPSLIHCPGFNVTINLKVNHFAPSVQFPNWRSRAVKKPSSRVFVLDSDQDELPVNDTLYFGNSPTYQNDFQFRHKGAANILYLDGHALRTPEAAFRSVAGIQFQWGN